MKTVERPMMQFLFSRDLHDNGGSELDKWVELVESVDLEAWGGGDTFHVMYPEDTDPWDTDIHDQRRDATKLAGLAIRAGLPLMCYRVGYDLEPISS